MATTSYSNWDFYNFHVQQELKGGQFVSAESTLIAAGPPEITSYYSGTNGGNGASNPSDGTIYPIGLLESVGLQQNKQLQRIFEIGSTRSYFVPGRNIGSISIGRTFYFGPSLLRVLYAYYRQTSSQPVPVASGSSTSATLTIDGDVVPDPNAPLLTVSDPSTLHQLERTPGEDYFWIDLTSDLFGQPTGMAMYFKDCNDVSVGAFYLEDCYVQGHQLNVSSGSVLVMEGVSMQYDQMRPIKVMTA